MGVQVDRFHICKDLLPADIDAGQTWTGLEEAAELFALWVAFSRSDFQHLQHNRLKQTHALTLPHAA